MPVPHPQYVAEGNIYGNRFFKTGTGPFGVLAASTNERILGITRSGTKYPAQPEISNTYLVESGDPVPAYGETDEALLVYGTTVAVGDLLKSDSSGRGVPIATSGTTLQEYGARALEAGAVGETHRVEVKTGNIYPALT